MKFVVIFNQEYFIGTPASPFFQAEAVSQKQSHKKCPNTSMLNFPATLIGTVQGRYENVAKEGKIKICPKHFIHFVGKLSIEWQY